MQLPSTRLPSGIALFVADLPVTGDGGMAAGADVASPDAGIADGVGAAIGVRRTISAMVILITATAIPMDTPITAMVGVRRSASASEFTSALNKRKARARRLARDYLPNGSCYCIDWSSAY